MSIIDDMPAPAVLSEGHDAQDQLNGHSSQNELLQSVWQEWTISATPVSFASQSHHLWIFGTAFGEAVPKTPRFSTHRLCRTQPVVELPRPTRSVISERAAKTAMRTQRLDSRPPGTVIGHRAIPLTPRDFDRQLRTVRYFTRLRKALLSPLSRLARCVGPFGRGVTAAYRVAPRATLLGARQCPVLFGSHRILQNYRMDRSG